MTKLLEYKKLIKWSLESFSDLPWRTDRNLYRTLVSEIMLQQTTVASVVKYYPEFIKKFPNFKMLALSSVEEVEIAWKGLGYYRRARNLLSAASDIETFYGGNLPLDKDSLLGIKGIGEYTAYAVRSIGANQRSLALDANLERVLSRIYGVQSFKGPALKKEIYQLFEKREILSEMETLGARAVNESLMDLGRTICRANSVDCEKCFFNKKCLAFLSQRPLDYPYKSKKQALKKEYEGLDLLRIIVWDKKRILGYKKKSGQWLKGQIEVPTFILGTSDENLEQYPYFPKIQLKRDHLISFKTTITKYKINNFILNMDHRDFKKIFKDIEISFEFFNSKESLENLSTATIKSLKIASSF